MDQGLSKSYGSSSYHHGMCRRHRLKHKQQSIGLQWRTHSYYQVLGTKFTVKNGFCET